MPLLSEKPIFVIHSPLGDIQKLGNTPYGERHGCLTPSAMTPKFAHEIAAQAMHVWEMFDAARAFTLARFEE